MAADRIEREVLIEAPVEVVWRVVTEPEHIVRWFADVVEVDPRPGGLGVLTFENQASNRPAVVPIVVQVVEPPRRFAFRWGFAPPPAPPPVAETATEPGRSVLVEFTLTAEDGRTRLRVVESGMLAMGWSDAALAEYEESHRKGWDTHLERLVDYAARLAGVGAR